MVFGKKSKKEPKKKSKKQIEKEEREEKEQYESEQRVQIAIKFLGNPNVQKASDLAKKQFLRKKGLSNEEIAEAFKQYAEEKKKLEEEKNKPQQQQQPNNDSQDQDQDNSQNEVETLETKLERAQESKFLSLKRMQIEQIDEKVFQITELNTLLLTGNPLQQIPQQIESFTSLKIFHAIDCGLVNSKIHENFWNLPELVELNLSKNRLSNIDQISNLKKLIRFEATDNEIMEIPENIDQCNSLRIINIRNNNIGEIPNSIQNLQQLSRLLISGNNLDKKIENVLKQDGVPGLKKFLSESF